jgi:ribosome-binding protein aMBF1 (putative translation factor)
MNASTDLIPLEDFIDKHVGPIGTERRNTFETGYDTFKLGVLIKTLRKQKGMSQEELAFRAGTNKAYISRVERNLKDIQFSTLQRIINEGLEANLEITIKPR